MSINRNRTMKEIIDVGRYLVSSGLTYSHFGNISVCSGNEILITRTGTQIGLLDRNSFVIIGLKEKSKADMRASVEADVHREIYQITKKKAVIHAHAPFSVALSLVHRKKIFPADSEGSLFLKDIPLVSGHSGTRVLGQRLGKMLLQRDVVINKGHGIFASAESLREALVSLTMAEHAVKILYYKTLYQKAFSL